MAKTAAERQRERRARLKEDPEAYEQAKLKDRLRKTEHRSSLTKSELNRLRYRNRIAVCKHRETAQLSQQEEQDVVELPVYNTPAAFGKARRRALRALPQSPRKKAAVVKMLAAEVLNSYVPRNNYRSISADVKNLVSDFYNSDSVSRATPGKADFVTVREAGQKKHEQKRHLLMTISEAFEMFKEDHPNTKIGLSKFAELRPKSVQLSSQMPHNVCGCKYHNNVILILEAAT